MSMIEKLIKELRDLRFRLGKYEKPLTEDWKIIDRAIDTIQSLSKKLSENNLNNGWIPCSERLPENHKDVLVQAKNYYGHANVFEIGFLGTDGKWYDNCGQSMEVTAWQPLPTPYKEGE